jgi:hypothetical protein
MILVRTNHPCLKVGCHSLYRSITGVIHPSCMVLISKTAVRICLDAHIRTIVVITGSMVTKIYILYLFYAIYFSVTTHLRPGKKVSILPLCDVNPVLVSSR